MDNILTYYNETKDTLVAETFDYKYRCSQCGVFCANISNIDKIISESRGHLTELLYIFGINLKHTSASNSSANAALERMFPKVNSVLKIEFNPSNYDFNLLSKIFENINIINFIVYYGCRGDEKINYIVIKHYSTMEKIPINLKYHSNVIGVVLIGNEFLKSINKTLIELSNLPWLNYLSLNTAFADDMQEISRLKNLRTLIVDQNTKISIDHIKNLSIKHLDINFNNFKITDSNIFIENTKLKKSLKKIILRNYTFSESNIPPLVYLRALPNLRQLTLDSIDNIKININGTFISIIRELFPLLRIINLHNIEPNISMLNKLRLFNGGITINKIAFHQCRNNDYCQSQLLRDKL